MLSDVTDLFEAISTTHARDRRLTKRVVDVWARAARGQYPSWAAMQEVGLGDDLGWTFVIDCKKSRHFPYFVFVGDRIAKFADIFLRGQADIGVSLLDVATADVSAASHREAPHIREEVVALCDGRELQFRSVTAPLADDGQTISHIVGAANGRFVAPAVMARI